MRNKTGFTPKDAAADILIGWLRAAYDGRTADVERCGPPAFQREVKRHLARLHNITLTSSGLDGTPLDEEPT